MKVRSRVSPALSASGVYTVVTRDIDFDTGGTYDLNLQFADGRCGPTIGYGQTRSGNFTSVIQHDIYRFTGRTNDTIIVTARTTQFGSLCVVAEIAGPIGPTGVLVGKNACNGEGRYTLRTDGIYTILLYDTDFDTGGTYDLNLTCIGPTCNSAQPAKPNQRRLRGPHPPP